MGASLEDNCTVFSHLAFGHRLATNIFQALLCLAVASTFDQESLSLLISASVNLLHYG
jgi:hypothetical protein